MKQKPLMLLGILLLVIAAFLLFMFQVRQSEVALVTTFGKATRSAEPGAHFKWPWPFQKVYKFDQRVQNFESPAEQVLSSDGFNLVLTVYAGWRVKDPSVFFPAFGDSMARARESLEGLVRNAYSGVVGRHPFAHFISTDPQELKLQEMETEMLSKVVSQATTYGIEVEFLGIEKLGLPESVSEVVFEQMRSERQVRVSEIQSEGERLASDIRSAADLESAKLLTDAQAQATRIEGQAARQAYKAYEIFEQNPDLAGLLLKTKALEAFLKERSTLILDSHTPPVDLLSPRPISP